MQSTYDVIVVGGGTAGVIAAIQAGRAGAKTLLVEKTGMLGGTLTHGGVSFPGIFNVAGRVIVGGIGWELICKTIAETGTPLPDTSAPNLPHWQYQTRVNGPLFAMLADEMVLESGAEILFHVMPAAAERTGDTWTLTLCEKTGLRSITGTVLIDCTGDANLISLTGYGVIKPSTLQPHTYLCRLGGYSNDVLDEATLTAAYRAALAQGKVKPTDGSWNAENPTPMQFTRSRGNNTNHIITGNAGDSAGKTEAELEGRRSVLRMVRFLRSQKGFENLTVETICDECGVRETAVIEGEYTITAADYETGVTFPDTVAQAWYPIDVHAVDGTGLRKRDLRPGVIPTIPRRALIPKGSTNLLAAGRIVSSDREANSALRVQAPCMAMGQAAGALAALAAARGEAAAAIPMAAVRDILLQHGAILPKA